MMLDLAEYAITNMKRRSLRSWLTIMGIVVGVFSMVIMISLAQGLDNYIRNQLSAFGDDLISIQPGKMSAETFGGFFGAATYLTENELERLRRLPEVKLGVGQVMGRTIMQYRNQQTSIYVVGTDPEAYTQMITYDLESGRWPRDNERGVAVIGNDVAKTVFDEEITVGRRIYLQNKSFSVIGILNKSGGISSTFNSMVLLTLKDGRDAIPEFYGNKNLIEIDLKVTAGTNLTEAEERITDTMLNARKLKKDKQDFTTVTAAYISQQVGNITGALSLFLTGIAAISLFVGSLGIANTMFMSIMERTREIGVMKAVGATPSMIRDVFLIEAGIIGLVGGILGVAISIIVSRALAFFGVPSDVTPIVMAGALLFSFLVGMISGYLPARQAARLDPVEALRFE